MPSTCGISQQVKIAEPWHFLGFFPNISQGDFFFFPPQRPKGFFFCFHSKDNSNICKWIWKHLSVQWSGCCLWCFSPDSRVGALEECSWRSWSCLSNITQTNISAQFLLFLCQPLWFWTDSSMCKFIVVSKPVIMSRCQAETSDGLNISNPIDDNDVLTASVGSGSAPPSCFPHLQSH